MSLSAVFSGLDGYEKPNAAQTAKTMKNPAREKNVYLDNLVRGENVRKDMVESSTRKRGKKKSSRKSVGAGGMGGYILFRTIKSNGSSKIIGADAAPTKELNNATLTPCRLVKSRMITNVAAADATVTLLTGLGAVYDW
jgi:hypothetical protein